MSTVSILELTLSFIELDKIASASIPTLPKEKIVSCRWWCGLRRKADRLCSSQRRQSEEQYTSFFLWELGELIAWMAHYKNITVILYRLLETQIPWNVKEW
jgi:hypothetical protein